MHGGTVEAASAGPGLGATFRVSLPTRLARQTVAPAARHPSALVSVGPAALPKLTGLRGVHVLAVDDEPEARNVLRAILESAGAEVEMASSGAEVLERLDARVPT